MARGRVTRPIGIHVREHDAVDRSSLRAHGSWKQQPRDGERHDVAVLADAALEQGSGQHERGFRVSWTMYQSADTPASWSRRRRR
jgi:hypothetical protein